MIDDDGEKPAKKKTRANAYSQLNESKVDHNGYSPVDEEVEKQC